MYNIRTMTGPTPYIHFPGTAREALTFYGEVFGGSVQLYTFAEFSRADGPAAPSTLRSWFTRLGEGGRVVDDLQTRPWGASDGQVIDRYGLHWLIGFEGDESV